MDQISPCIHDELALFVKNYRRVVKDKTKVTRNCQNLPSSSTRVSQENVLKEMNFLDSYGFRENKSLKDLVKCYICGGAGYIDVKYANNFALVGSVHNSSLARVHVVKEGKSDSRNESVSGDDRQDDQSYRDHDDQSYKE
ncbi:hypothetical protein L3X38_034026 [Prunus dulcis]|uniref:Uncharacterized protein n=1 Tax=Prunus dulcis TaxID=3755 RepID=A0AAD4YY61_PRUDU|nr:hypothetical protein L3X38_034026 [Prunus dulcis]